jgi:hypothetical protein
VGIESWQGAGTRSSGSGKADARIDGPARHAAQVGGQYRKLGGASHGQRWYG